MYSDMTAKPSMETGRTAVFSQQNLIFTGHDVQENCYVNAAFPPDKDNESSLKFSLEICTVLFEVICSLG